MPWALKYIPVNTASLMCRAPHTLRYWRGGGLGTEHLEPRFLNFRVLKRRDSKLTSLPSAALDMGSLGKRWGPDWCYGGGGCLYSKGSSLVKLTGSSKTNTALEVGRGLPGKEGVDHREWEGDRVMRGNYD